MARTATLFLLSALFLADATAAQVPSADWRTITTPHFRVHFPAPFAAWAKRTASALEAIHERVTGYVGYRPPRAIDVVIGDPQADANGMAFPFLDRPVVVLWATPPESESAIGDYPEWMDLVATHEVAHIVHLTRPRNRPGLLQRLLPLPLGPVFLNSPRWLAEGYATVVEGALTGSGRPNSSFRAMVLRRFAVEGKLPSYGALSGTSGWLGGSMAYLVGSGYLEWLEEREGPGALPRLWKRMASRRGGDFTTAFRGVFGRSPADLYDRFRAELTAGGIEEERRRKAAGLAQGELWQRLRGATLSPQVSPGGERLLARRDPERGESYLAVWTVEESRREREADERRRKREAELLRDPNEVAEKPETPRPREPRWRLPVSNGRAAENPRWMPDSRRILFSRRAPDGEGLLHSDLYLWRVDDGRVRRVTRLADVSAADPAPDGSWAAGVRNRYGISELVRVDLASGRTHPIETGPAADPWRVWDHPRVSPDGRLIAALLHEEGEWWLVTVPAVGGPLRVIACHAVGPPAWAPDGKSLNFGTDATGVWEIASVELESDGAPAQLTRVTGGAFSPAPAPDGGSLFFLELTAKGVDLRRLALPAAAVAPLPPESRYPILPPPRRAPVAFPLARVPRPRPYRALETQVVRFASAFTAGPDGTSYQMGAQGTDVVGRLDWMALGAFGNAAGPRGGSIGAAWSGLPVKLTLQLFSALEKPGSQRLVPRPDLDSERRGGFAGAAWQRMFEAGRLGLEAGGGWTRVRSFSDQESFSRTLGSARVHGLLRRTRGKFGFALSLDLEGSYGRTAGASWNQFSGAARVSGITGFATASLRARWGDTSGSPTRFDLFAVGGAGSAILPPGIDRNRVESPALPFAVQSGERVEAYRAELAFAGLPLVLYGERLRAWSPPSGKPGFVRVAGAELRLERLLPPELSGSLSFYLGVARVESSAPRFASTRGYAGLIYRP